MRFITPYAAASMAILTLVAIGCERQQSPQEKTPEPPPTDSAYADSYTGPVATPAKPPEEPESKNKRPSAGRLIYDTPEDEKEAEVATYEFERIAVASKSTREELAWSQANELAIVRREWESAIEANDTEFAKEKLRDLTIGETVIAGKLAAVAAEEAEAAVRYALAIGRGRDHQAYAEAERLAFDTVGKAYHAASEASRFALNAEGVAQQLPNPEEKEFLMMLIENTRSVAARATNAANKGVLITEQQP